MQINSSQIKSYLLFLYLTAVRFSPVHAQDPVDNYLHQVEYYAEIYNGRLEMTYNRLHYENLPYYMNDDYAEATVIYRNNYYPNQKARLDLFKEQLIVLVPKKQYGIILDSRDVSQVDIHNKTFVWLVPSKGSGLKDGYYIQLLTGNRLQLFCKESYTVQPQETTYRFYPKIQHYLLYSDYFYPVKNKTSFFKIFPQYKKQINKFSRDRKLNFKQDKDKSLTSLAEYCESLLNLEGK